MNFIFAKLFEEYSRKNDSPKFNITSYISFVYLLVLFAILLPTKIFFDKKIFDNQLEYDRSTIMITVIGLFTLITITVYNIYIKNKRIFKLVDRYKATKINKGTLYLIIILIPVMLILIAGTVTVYLNGGKILGIEISGLIE